MYNVIVGACVLPNQDEDIKLGIGFEVGNSSTMKWNFKDDMVHFRNTTLGHFVLMGRKTWDTIPEIFKPLPSRINIVVSSKAKQYNTIKKVLLNKDVLTNNSVNIDPLENEYKKYNYVHFVETIEEGWNFYLECIKKEKYANKELFVMGGGTIYTQIIEKYPNNIDKLYLTKVFNNFESNVYFELDKYFKLNKKLINESSLKKDINTMPPNQEIFYKLCVYKFITICTNTIDENTIDENKKE